VYLVRHILCTTVRDAAHQINTVLLHLLVPEHKYDGDGDGGVSGDGGGNGDGEAKSSIISESASIGNTHKKKAIPVLENWGQTRQEVFDGGGHLLHAHHIHNALERPQDATQHLKACTSVRMVLQWCYVRVTVVSQWCCSGVTGVSRYLRVLLAQVLVQHHTQVAQQ
jgi:hypothetical protein